MRAPSQPAAAGSNSEVITMRRIERDHDRRRAPSPLRSWRLAAVAFSLLMTVTAGVGSATEAAAATSHDLARITGAARPHFFAGHSGYWLFGSDGRVYAEGPGAD